MLVLSYFRLARPTVAPFSGPRGEEAGENQQPRTLKSPHPRQSSYDRR